MRMGPKLIVEGGADDPRSMEGEGRTFATDLQRTTRLNNGVEWRDGFFFFVWGNG